jgi:hemolysin activation/secretion protein
MAASAPATTIRALVFLATPDQLVPQGVPLASVRPAEGGPPVDLARAPLLQAGGFAQHIAASSVLGAPLEEASLARLRAAVFDWLRAQGRGAVVMVPAQDATSGVVQVVVMQPRLGALHVEGAKLFPEDAYRGAVRARPGEPLDSVALDEDRAWIQRSNPYRSAVAVAAPGRQPGETDITLQVSEQRPWKANVWADNTGTAATQRAHLGAGIAAGNFLGLGHVASYNLAASADLRTYVGHTVTYALPLPWRDKLNFAGNYARVRARMPEPLASHGESSGVTVRYDHTLRNIASWAQSASLSLDYKDSDNNVLFSSTPVFGNRTRIVQFLGGYEGGAADARGETQVRVGLALSPGGLVARNDDAAFAGSRAGAKARYRYATLSLLRGTDLAARWRWTADARLQWASTNLLGSEQLGAMGMYGVRGFPEGGLYADRGLVWRNEIGPGAFALGTAATAQIFAIADTATVRNTAVQAGEQQRYRFSSAGLGARLSAAGWQARFEAAKPIAANGQSDRGGWRLHARVSWEY